ncbi:MAG: hypothetical protein FWG72_10305 [Oscillospiraceae bacterium]|nr:hypothetical protein [Oscillospiraceae bacterium]
MKEFLKTALLILLGLSAAFLVYRTWVYDNSLFGREMQGPAVFAPERLDYAPASAVPAGCAVMLDGIRTGARYDTETRDVYNAFKILLADAFGSVTSAEPLTGGRAWQSVLQSDGVYFEFTGSLPISLLTAWLSADGSRLPVLGIPLDSAVESIGLAFGDGAVRLFWSCPDGEFWLAETEAEFSGWPELPELRPCAFAFESDYAAGWAPRQLLIDETRPRPTAVISAPPDIRQSDSAYAPFLETLELFVGSTTHYDRSGGRVYVDIENGRTCEFFADGSVLFSNPAAARSASLSNDSSVAADVLRAWEALSRLELVMGGGRFEVSRVTQSPGGTAVEFFVMFGGVPVRWESAVVETAGGELERITLRLCVIEEGEGAGVPLPLRLAAALGPQNGAARLDLRYLPVSRADAEADVFWVVSE